MKVHLADTPPRKHLSLSTERRNPITKENTVYHLQSSQLQRYQFFGNAQRLAHLRFDIVRRRLHRVVIDNVSSRKSTCHGAVQIEPRDTAGRSEIVALLAARWVSAREYGAEKGEVEGGGVVDVANWKYLGVFGVWSQLVCLKERIEEWWRILFWGIAEDLLV